MAHDVGQLLLSAQFAVGNVEELGRSMDLAQCVPGLDVGGLVVAIARIDLVMDRHSPVVGDAQAVDQLLQIGTMILAMAIAQLHAGTGPSRDPSEGLYRGAVIVDALEIEVEGPDGRDDQPCHQGGSVTTIQLVQRPGEAVVAEAGRRSCAVAQRAQIP